jgi:hypothetical protein
MTTFAALATGRRNLAQRLTRFVAEPPPGGLSGYQVDQVLQAIELLCEERFAEGERLMLQAERADAFEPAGYQPIGRETAAGLAARLAAVLPGGDE